MVVRDAMNPANIRIQLHCVNGNGDTFAWKLIYCLGRNVQSLHCAPLNWKIEFELRMDSCTVAANK